MQELYQKYKTYIIYGAVAIVLVVGALYFFGGNDQPALVSQTATGQANIAVGQDLLKQLLELRSLSLNEKLFAEPEFQALKDFSQKLPAQPVGRRNPFAPLGSE